MLKWLGMNTEPGKTFVTKRIGFVGAGKVGCSFGRYIMEEGAGAFTVSGYFSRDPVSARAAADLDNKFLASSGLPNLYAAIFRLSVLSMR